MSIHRFTPARHAFTERAQLIIATTAAMLGLPARSRSQAGTPPAALGVSAVRVQRWRTETTQMN
ncbi:hypothetical protein OU995_05090 [Roseateles sp. SL47]|uniref:hypothetical protein n=1 Tax=Roseateles sp. SL47 TaxID=2995138 RepID=UPI00227076C4|nr:hypothetical protein [Roseateles sp. SL47]WAC74107.1 hypothetical protein OU995_05090 [Roseateles sp. SL47]